MISVKRAEGSDALAVNACMPDHHVQSTRTSREILEYAGIDIEKQHEKLWCGFLQTLDRMLYGIPSQEEFEFICGEYGLREKAPAKRKANFR